ncbi:NAD-dependent epimerase/dehydratase family protein [Iamia sp. SCSIO 61187]|nr:NAD-dependent epimerase/dehydratase family protein [Iamia sp. SCSIO 61187]
MVVAVTGPTGTFGHGVVPLLERDPRVGRIVGIARRPFDPAALGWSKMEYRQGDVRDEEALAEVFAGADVVVHLAFLITGTASREVTRDINIGGTLNAFRAAAAAGVRRFVYASSVAAYGFHSDNPVGMTEDWPTRPAHRLFYAQEKAELEGLLEAASAAAPDLGLYLLRPPIVLGPHAMGAKDILPGPLEHLGRSIAGAVDRLPFPLPVLAPDVPVQLIHEDDVGQALLLCAVGAGPPGAYNIAADDTLTGAEIAGELGLAPLPIPAKIVHAAARSLAALPTPPLVPPLVEWVEAMSHPSVMDTTKAKDVLGWMPRWSSRGAIRSTLGRPADGGGPEPDDA